MADVTITGANAVRLVCRHCGEVYFGSSSIDLHAECKQLVLPMGFQPRMKFLAAGTPPVNDRGTLRPCLFGITEDGVAVIWSWHARTWVPLAEFADD